MEAKKERGRQQPAPKFMIREDNEDTAAGGNSRQKNKRKSGSCKEQNVDNGGHGLISTRIRLQAGTTILADALIVGLVTIVGPVPSPHACCVYAVNRSIATLIHRHRISTVEVEHSPGDREPSISSIPLDKRGRS
jgi:hypothetical protein